VYKVVSKLLNILIENTLDSARTDTMAAQKFIEYQITEYEKRLTTSELKLAEFKRANLGLMPDKRGGYYKKLQHEQRALEDVRSELRLAQRKYSEMKKQLKGELPLLGSNRYREQKALKLRKYREQLEILLTQYTDQHPDVQAVKAAIADVLAEDGGDEATYMNGDPVELSPVYQALKSDIRKEGIEVETLKLKLQEKENTVKQLKQSVDVIPGIEAKLAKLNRDYDITRERYLRLVERREEARMAQDVGQSGSNISFQIIEPPRIPVKPSGPNRILFLTIVFLVAISAGLGWGFLRYFLRPTFILPGQVSDKTGFPVLGSVGLFVTAEHKARRKMQLTTFLVVFSLLVVSYGGSLVFREPGSNLVKLLIS
jgi:polysaccharide chain length determinant protein (PEP-CTERM system associated)